MNNNGNQRAHFERRAEERRAMDRESFHRNMGDALRAVHSARSFASDGRADAVWNCMMLAAHHRNIAKQFLRPEFEGAWPS